MKLSVDGQQIPSSNSMKVLGVIFDDKLSWEAQVKSAIAKTHRTIHGLRMIRRHLNPVQAKHVVTAYYFSTLYYGAEVWYHKQLSYGLKRKIKSAHYRALRFVYGKASHEDLDILSGRASPEEYSDFITAKMAARIINEQNPVRLHDSLVKNCYSERRIHERVFFFDNSHRKIGKQCLRNRLQTISRQMKFSWTSCDRDTLRIGLKKCFFKYYKTCDQKS